MTVLEVEHTQPPIYGYPLSARKEPALVRISVKVGSSKKGERVGAVRAAWQVTLQTPAAGRSIQECWEWGKPQALETILTEVSDEGTLIKDGDDLRAEFTLYLPSYLPPTTVTDFEKVIHKLYVSAYPPAPTYLSVGPSSPTSPTGSGSGFGTSPPDRPGNSRWKSLGSLVSHKQPKAPPPPARTKSTMGNPLADAFGPPIASYETEIRYLTPLHERGVSPLYDFTKVAIADGLGVVRVTAVSNVMTTGSAFIMCLRVDSVGPSTIIHTAQIRLLQQSSSADGTEVHHDEYILHRWFEPPDEEGNPRPLWPGPSAYTPKSPVFPPRTSEDGLHLSALPRLPSPAAGGKVSTVLDGQLSKTKHTLFVDIEFSTADGSSTDGPKPRRKAQLPFDLRLGDCTMSYNSVQTPRYTAVEPQQLVDLKACLEPYEKGAEPKGCHLERLSWIVRDGKALEKRRIGYSRERTRAHQLETSSICMCFFENVTGGDAVDGPSYTDSCEPYTGPLDSDTLDAHRIKADTEFLAKTERKNIPGFIHVYMSDCLCQENLSATGTVRKKPGALTAHPVSGYTVNNDNR